MSIPSCHMLVPVQVGETTVQGKELMAIHVIIIRSN